MVTWKQPRICENCHKEFTPIYKPQKFCSRQCSMIVNGKAARTRITVKCARCGKEFERVLSAQAKNNYCSLECCKENLIKVCENCGKEYECNITHRKTSRFCTRSCAKSGKFHPYYDKEGPTKGMSPWTKGLTKETDERIAQLGEKVSATQKEQFALGIRSNAGEDNPNFGKTLADRTPEQREHYSLAAIKRVLDGHVPHGKNAKHGHHFSTKMNTTYYYRSSLEERLMICYDKDPNVDKFIYEPFSIKYGIGRRYLPDFVVTRGNSTELVEVKPAFQLEEEKVVLKAEAGKKYAEEQGWEYLLLTLQDIKAYEVRLGIQNQCHSNQSEKKT